MGPEREAVREAFSLRVLQHHRGVHREQVSAVHELGEEVRGPRHLRAVQMQVRFRQEGREQEGEWVLTSQPYRVLDTTANNIVVLPKL